MRDAYFIRAHAPGLLQAAAFLLLLLYAAFFLSPDLADLSGDSARYLLLGQALAQGRGYVELQKPGLPPHTEFAPGLPSLLALLSLFLSPSLTPAKVLIFLFLAISVFFLPPLARLAFSFDRLTASLLALALASLPHLARFSNLILSDLPYTATSLLALLLLYRLLRQENSPPQTWFFAGLVLSLSFFFRQTALALWLASVCGLLCHRPFLFRRRLFAATLLTLAFFLPVSLWFLRNTWAAGAPDPVHWAKLFSARASDPFAGQLTGLGLLRRTAEGLLSYPSLSGLLWLDLPAAFFPRFVHLAAALLFLLPGFFSLLQRFRRPGPLEWYVVFYLLVISVWESHYPRYLIPLLPLLLLLSADGAARAGQRFRRGERRAPDFALGAVFFLAAVVTFNLAVFIADVLLVRRAPATTLVESLAGAEWEEAESQAADLRQIFWGYWYQYPDLLASPHPRARAQSWHRLLAACRWMAEHLPGGAVVAARKPALAAYYSGRFAVQYPAEISPAAFFRRCEEEGITHFLLDEASPAVRRLFHRHLTAAGPGLAGGEVPPVLVVFRAGDTLILEWRSPSGRGRSGGE